MLFNRHIAAGEFGPLAGFFRREGCRLCVRAGDAFAVQGVVIAKELLGSVVNYSVRDKEGNVYIVSTESEDFSVNQNLWVGSLLKNIYVFDGKGQRVREGVPAYAQLLDAVRRL